MSMPSAASQTQDALGAQAQAENATPETVLPPQKVKAAPLKRGPLWARLPPLRTLAPSSSQSPSQPQSQLAPCASAAAKEPIFPQISLPDRVSTTRVLLQDTQACIQKLSARMDAIAARNEHAVKEVDLARTALESSCDRCVAQISEAVRDSRASVMERIDSQCIALEKMQEMLNNNSTKLEAVYRLYDVQSSILTSLLQTSHSQTTLLNSLQQQQTNITQSTLPLEPLLQAIPLRIDNMTHTVRTAVEDVFSHAIPALLERTLTRIQAPPLTLLTPEALSGQTDEQRQNFGAHIARSPIALTATSPTIVGTNGPPSTPLVDKFSSVAGFASTANVDTTYAVPPGNRTVNTIASQKRKGRAQSNRRTSAAPPQNTRNPSAETNDSPEAGGERPSKRTRIDTHTATESTSAQQTAKHADMHEISRPPRKTSKRPLLARASVKSTTNASSNDCGPATKPKSVSNKTPLHRRPGAIPPEPIAGPATRTRSVYNFAAEAGLSIAFDDSPAHTTSSTSPESMQNALDPPLSPPRAVISVQRADADGGGGDHSSEALQQDKVVSESTPREPPGPGMTNPPEAAEATVVVQLKGRLPENAELSHAAPEAPQPSSKKSSSSKSKSKPKSASTPRVRQSRSSKSNTKPRTKATPKTTTAAARSLMQIMRSSSPPSPDQSMSRSSGDAATDGDEDENTAAFGAALAHIAKDVDFMRDPSLVARTPSRSQSISSTRKQHEPVSSPSHGIERRFGSIVQTNIPPPSQIEISDSEFDHFFPELADL